MRRGAAPVGDYNFGDFGAEPTAGRSSTNPPTFYDADNITQEQALAELAKLTVEDTVDPHIRRAAIKIVRNCEARDDICELTALFEAVKNGDPQVHGLENGLKYLSDPVYRDFYVRPSRALAECEDGSCAGDCDDHAMLIGALAGTLGFQVGLRAYKRKGAASYEHVYAVAGVPKINPTEVFGLDTSADAGPTKACWEPPEGEVLTAWLEGEG